LIPRISGIDIDIGRQNRRRKLGKTRKSRFGDIDPIQWTTRSQRAKALFTPFSCEPRMSAARRDPRNACKLICDIFQEIVERYHSD
jgi:hypothetical protein